MSDLINTFDVMHTFSYVSYLLMMHFDCIIDIGQSVKFGSGCLSGLTVILVIVNARCESIL